MAEQASTVSAVMLSCRNSEFGSAFIAVGAITPGRFFSQHIQQSKEKLFCSNLIVEDIDSLIVVNSQASPSSHYCTTQVSVSLHVSQEEH